MISDYFLLIVNDTFFGITHNEEIAKKADMIIRIRDGKIL